MYQSEIKVVIQRKVARRIGKHLAGCGFVTHVQEVSDLTIGDVDQFRIVIYHESFKAYVCKQTGYSDNQFIDKNGLS